MNEITKYSFSVNDIDFICFKHNGSFWTLCFNGFLHGFSSCRYVPGGESLRSIAECYNLAESVKSANY